MILILEGPDNAGKSTLAAQLQANIPSSIVLHRGPPALGMLQEYERPLDQLRDVPVICDRWHVGELVYGPLLRNGTRLTPIDRWHIELYLHSRGGLIVHVGTPIEVIRRRLRERGDDLVTADQLPSIIRGYEDVLTYSHCPQLKVEDSGSTSMNEILEAAYRCEEETRQLKPFETYIGGPRPLVLLLGETRGRPRNESTQYHAAFAPEPATSGKFLLEALNPRHWRRGELGIANACDESVLELWAALGQPRIVTLGQVARGIATAHNLPHEAVYHPQYERRFKTSQKAQYGAEIRKKAGKS